MTSTARRLHHLVGALIAALDAKRSAVHLHVGLDDVLRASLQLDAAQGQFILPVHFADSVALAEQKHVPLLSSAQDLARVPVMRLGVAELAAPEASPALPPVSKERVAPPVFRAFFESLELDDFGSASEGA